MTDATPKKPHSIGWYAAWIVLALVMYVASFGPASWMRYHYGHFFKLGLGRAIDAAYSPIIWLRWHGPDWLVEAILWYARLGMGEPWPGEQIPP